MTASCQLTLSLQKHNWNCFWHEQRRSSISHWNLWEKSQPATSPRGRAEDGNGQPLLSTLYLEDPSIRRHIRINLTSHRFIVKKLKRLIMFPKHIYLSNKWQVKHCGCSKQGRKASTLMIRKKRTTQFLSPFFLETLNITFISGQQIFEKLILWVSFFILIPSTFATVRESLRCSKATFHCQETLPLYILPFSLGNDSKSSSQLSNLSKVKHHLISSK